MTRSSKAWCAVLLGVLSAAALAWAATAAPEGYTPLRHPNPRLAMAHAQAAEAAFGRRVLVLEVRGDRASGEVYESARAGAGWELFSATPPGERALAETLAAVADAAATEYAGRKGFGAETLSELARHGIALVQWTDAAGPRHPDGVYGATLSVLAGGGAALRVPGAEIVWRVDGGPESPASILDPRDGLWGGAVTVDAPTAGTYRFAWPAAGARVTADGDATPTLRADDDGYLLIDLPAGRTRVAATYVGDGTRGIIAVLGGAGLAVAVLALMLLFRPQLEHDQAG